MSYFGVQCAPSERVWLVKLLCCVFYLKIAALLCLFIFRVKYSRDFGETTQMYYSILFDGFHDELLFSWNGCVFPSVSNYLSPSLWSLHITLVTLSHPWNLFNVSVLYPFVNIVMLFQILNY